MKRKIEVIPSILTNSPEEAVDLLDRCHQIGGRVSVDIIDGKYADNKTIDPSVLDDLDTNAELDIQLMVVEPINWIKKSVTAGADRVIGHIEKMSDQIDFVAKVQGMGAKVGLGLDLGTPLSRLEKQILDSLDVILLMSVPAGFGGQKFNKKVIAKISKLAELRKTGNYRFKIHVDGGITADNIGGVVSAGADEVSVGRLIFKGDLKENTRNFKKSATKLNSQ